MLDNKTAVQTDTNIKENHFLYFSLPDILMSGGTVSALVACRCSVQFDTLSSGTCAVILGCVAGRGS